MVMTHVDELALKGNCDFNYDYKKMCIQDHTSLISATVKKDPSKIFTKFVRQFHNTDVS